MLTTLQFEPGATPAQVAQDVLAAWPDSKVFHIKGPAPSGDIRDFYWAFMGIVGAPLPIAEDAGIGDRGAQRTGGYWFEVRYDPASRDAYRHSAEAQPLHTDLSYVPVPNAVGLLGCVAMPDNGGATTFIDAVDLIAAMEDEAPQLLDRLEQAVLPHARSGDRRVEKVIRRDDDQILLNWNYYCVDPDVGDDGQALREAFFQFLKASPGVAARTVRVKLAPGDAVIWKDEHVLHGRDAFDADKPSERFLWKSSMLVEA